MICLRRNNVIRQFNILDYTVLPLAIQICMAPKQFLAALQWFFGTSTAMFNMIVTLYLRVCCSKCSLSIRASSSEQCYEPILRVAFSCTINFLLFGTYYFIFHVQLRTVGDYIWRLNCKYGNMSQSLCSLQSGCSLDFQFGTLDALEILSQESQIYQIISQILFQVNQVQGRHPRFYCPGSLAPRYCLPSPSGQRIVESYLQVTFCNMRRSSSIKKAKNHMRCSQYYVTFKIMENLNFFLDHILIHLTIFF